MRNKTNSFRLVFMLVLIFALAAFPGSASANHSWGKYHWARTSNPFTLKVGDNVNSTWDTYLNEAISDWNPSTVLDLSKVNGSTTGSTCAPTSGRIEVCNAAYGTTGWLGIAQIWTVRGSHIAQATTKVNDTYFNQAQYNTPAWRRLVMCQESAHDFGLDHQDENFDNPNLGTCMDYTSNPAGNEHPNQHDYDQLVSIYSHLDSTTTIGAALPSTVSPAMRNLVLNSVEQFGPVVKAVKNGPGLATYHEQDFGNGNKVITHVFWTLDRN